MVVVLRSATLQAATAPLLTLIKYLFQNRLISSYSLELAIYFIPNI